MLQVYDLHMQPLFMEDKGIVHQKGLWHKVFTGVLYYPEENKIYFQTVFPKENYAFDRPDYIDFGVGGHVEGAESVVEAGIRETGEELGLTVTPGQFSFLGIRICSCDPSPSYKIREFQFFYGIRIADRPENLHIGLTDREVKSIVELDIDDFLRLLFQHTTEISAREILTDREGGRMSVSRDIVVTPDRIIPDYFSDKSVAEKILTLKAVMETAGYHESSV